MVETCRTYRWMPAAAALLLAGCAAPEGYPSLSPRPIEAVSLAEPAPRPAPPATPSAAAAARYAPAITRARTADAAFRTMLAARRPSIVAGRRAIVGSDAWVDAQRDLSRLVTAHVPVASALADLQAASETPEAASDPGLAAAVAEALATVAAIDAREAQAITALDAGG